MISDCILANLPNHNLLTYDGLVEYLNEVPVKKQKSFIKKFIKKFPCYEEHLNEKFKGDTWLSRAIKHHNISFIKAIISLGAELENINSSGDSALTVARAHGVSEKFFVKKNPTAQNTNISKNAIITEAPKVSKYAAPKTYADFLEYFDLCIKEDNARGLEEKSNHPYSEFLQLKYLYVSENDEETGQTLLHRSIVNGASRAFIHFLDKEWLADERLGDHRGKTAFHYAAIYNRPDIYYQLKAKEQWSEMAGLLDENKQSPFHEAAIHGCVSMLWDSLKKYASEQWRAREQDKQGFRLLHLAAMHGQTAAVNCLLSSDLVEKQFKLFNSTDNDLKLTPLDLDF